MGSCYSCLRNGRVPHNCSVRGLIVNVLLPTTDDQARGELVLRGGWCDVCFGDFIFILSFCMFVKSLKKLWGSCF